MAERDLLLGWLQFHRDALAAKGEGMSDAQEYARHNGHADIVRERIDGLRGE